MEESSESEDSSLFLTDFLRIGKAFMMNMSYHLFSFIGISILEKRFQNRTDLGNHQELPLPYTRFPYPIVFC